MPITNEYSLIKYVLSDLNKTWSLRANVREQNGSHAKFIIGFRFVVINLWTICATDLKFCVKIDHENVYMP
jgi:hypothetical protein